MIVLENIFTIGGSIIVLAVGWVVWGVHFLLLLPVFNSGLQKVIHKLNFVAIVGYEKIYFSTLNGYEKLYNTYNLMGTNKT